MKGITHRLYTCCPESGCTTYRDSLHFLNEEWGIEPALGHDGDHYFEFTVPDDWPAEKARAFEVAFRERFDRPEPDETCLSMSIHLFGKPEWMLGRDERPLPEDLRVTGDFLKDHLHEVADAIEKLTADGWDVDLGLYDLDLSAPDDIWTAEQARQRLTELGIDPDLIDIHEDGDGADDQEDDKDDDEADEVAQDAAPVGAGPLAWRMWGYVKERAKVEGVGFCLPVGFFEEAIHARANPIFGVVHDGGKMLRDEQEPREGFFARHAPNG